MTNVGSKVPFFQLCNILERIQKKRGNDNKKKLLKEFVDEWRSFHAKIHEDDKDTTDSFYPAMRLLLPQLEREREAYGIKEVVLAKLYIDILGLGKNSPAAQKLLNYRAPKSAKSDAGDFAVVCHTVLQARCPEKGTLTIEDVNNCLDKVAQCNANKDKPGQKKALEHMLRNMSAREQKWLIRMIMKEMKMGLSQQSVFSLYHQDSEDLYNVKMSLKKVCEMLKDPSVRLHEIEISLFSPFRPMLGDRGQPSKIEKVMDNKPYLIETKFDGERMQLHKKDDEYKFFSRGGNEYTGVFGKDMYDGSLTPYISNCFKPSVNNCILDGEMVGFDPVTETIGTKGQNFDVKSADMKEYQPMLCVFDILMLNNQVLSNKPLRERKDILKDVFNPVHGRIMLSAYKEGRTKEDCIEALNEAIDTREEGIMVKNPESAYKPNDRKGGWYKVKPDYMSGVMDELDVIVVGGNFGGGHRSNLMSHFLCAVAVPLSDGEKPTEFHTFCRVGSGYTRKELYEFNQKLADHWQMFNKNKPPRWLQFAPGLKQRPECFIEPDKSCILQIRAAEIVPSDQFKTECTLRFPRVEKIRDDKAWYDCMTTSELEDLRDKASGKLATCASGKLATRLMDFEDDDEGDGPKKKKRRVPQTTRHVKPTLMARFAGADVSTVKKVSEMLSGKELCIISGSAGHNNKAFLEQKVVEFGGTVVQNAGDDTYCVIADRITIKVRNLIAKDKYDIVKADWLIRCVEQKSFIPWKPSDMIHTSPKTVRKFALNYDKHGDSFYEDTNVEQLKAVFEKIEKEGSTEVLSSAEIADIEMNYFPHDSYYGLFRTCKVYVDENLVLGQKCTHIKNSPLELVGLDLHYHGGIITDSIDQDVTHVLVCSRDLSRIQSLRNVNKKRVRKFHIVTERWVEDCMEKEKLLQERHYDPPAPQV